jgi:hypothetical protein
VCKGWRGRHRQPSILRELLFYSQARGFTAPVATIAEPPKGRCRMGYIGHECPARSRPIPAPGYHAVERRVSPAIHIGNSILEEGSQDRYSIFVVPSQGHMFPAPETPALQPYTLSPGPIYPVSGERDAAFPASQ